MSAATSTRIARACRRFTAAARRSALAGLALILTMAAAVTVPAAATSAVAATGQAGAADRPPGVETAVPPAPAARSASASQVLDPDLSGTLPVLSRDETVGDFLNEGHDQRAAVAGGHLDIYNSPQYGGGLVRSTPTDLKATPNYVVGDNLWQNNCGFQACNYEQVGDQYGLSAVPIASSASNIYIAGATGTDGSGYQLHLYKLPHDGSCASAACADKSVDLQSFYTDNFHGIERVIAATSLAVGVVEGQTYIAVGFSDYGLLIFNQNLQRVAGIGDMADGNDQTPVISLAFGPSTGPGEGGLLVGGVLSPGSVGYSWHLNPDGTEKSVAPFGAGGGTALTEPLILATAVARIDGKLVTVLGRSDGDVILVDPDSANTQIADLPVSQRFGAVTGLTAVTPWNGDPADQDLVIGKRERTNDEVLRYTDGALGAIPVREGGATTGTADQIELWYPGYAAGRLRVANDTAGSVSVSLASRPDPGYGCWLNASVKGGVPAFPVGDTAVAAGDVSPQFFVGALTAGVNGDCASAAGQGERSAYVVATPAGDRADTHLIKLRVSQTGAMRVSDQAGGYLNATVAQVSAAGGAWGAWELKLTGGAAPAAVAAPSVQGYRLTSAPGPDYTPPDSPVADDPARPVYRFDVTGARWSGIAAPGQVTAQIPAMTAQGSVDGTHWQDLGRLMPSTAPGRAGDAVTLGPASFFWQDPPRVTPLTEVRVVSGALASSPMALKSLVAPPIDGGPGATSVSGLTVTPEAPGGTAVPRADGVDQAALNVQLTPATAGGIILPSDPRYNLVYYRYSVTNNLVTGLYTPGDYADYVAAGPYASSGGGPGQVVRNYLTTTSRAAQSLIGEMNDSGTTSAFNGSALAVAATRNPLTATGTAAGGIAVTGCASSPTATCTLTAPTGTAPVLYQAGGPADGPVTGLQLAVTATTGRASLPLQVGTANAHTLASAPLLVTRGQAKLLDTSGFFPSDTIDTALVTAGQLVPIESVKVGG